MLGPQLRSPERWLSDMSEVAMVHKSGIHGDLHGQNVVLDGGGNPHLIDFAFTTKLGPTLIDFTLLEATIRLMRFPRSVNPVRFLDFQASLNEEYGYLAVKELVHHWQDPMSFAFLRAATLIGRIRIAAETACGKSWDFREYRRALFATCFGCVAYDSYPLLYTLHTLDLLGRAITG